MVKISIRIPLRASRDVIYAIAASSDKSGSDIFMFRLARFRLYLLRMNSRHNSIPETGLQFRICATVRILFHFLQPELSSLCVCM